METLTPTSVFPVDDLICYQQLVEKCGKSSKGSSISHCLTSSHFVKGYIIYACFPTQQFSRWKFCGCNDQADRMMHLFVTGDVASSNSVRDAVEFFVKYLFRSNSVCFLCTNDPDGCHLNAICFTIAG